MTEKQKVNMIVRLTCGKRYKCKINADISIKEFLNHVKSKFPATGEEIKLLENGNEVPEELTIGELINKSNRSQVALSVDGQHDDNWQTYLT